MLLRTCEEMCCTLVQLAGSNNAIKRSSEKVYMHHNLIIEIIS